MGRLDGQTALITGGASGLGRAIVDRFVEEGARVVVIDRSPDKLQAVAADLPGAVRTLTGDVRSASDNAAAVRLAEESFGRLDCAIGNAGIWDYSVALDDAPVESLDPAFDEIFHVNVKGALHLAKAALPALVRTQGSLVFTVSNAGFDPGGGGALYTASKHALVGLIRQLAYEFAPLVRVNGVAPGPISTDLRGPEALGLADTAISQIDLDSIAAPSVPLGLVPRPEDYAGAYVMLASRRDNVAATGGVIALDAGIAVRGIGRVSQGGGLAAKHLARGDGA